MPPFCDSLLAKLIVRGAYCTQVLERMAPALRELRIEGLPTDLEFLASLIKHSEVRRVEITTRWVEASNFRNQQP